MIDMPDPNQLLEAFQRKTYQDMCDIDKRVRREREEECRLRAVAAGKPLPPPGRLRLPGGGRKSLPEKYPDLIPSLYGMLTPPRTPDFVPPIQWITLTDKEIASRLCNEGFQVSAGSIPSLLHRAGLRVHPAVRIPKNRPTPKDRQFNFINRHVTEALCNGQRVYFVDFHVNPAEMPEPDSIPPDIAHERRCERIADLLCRVLKYLWYDLQDDSCPMIVLEGGTIIGIANDHFHARLEELANEMDMNLLLSYLPSGISRWTCAKRILEERRLFVYDERAVDEAFVTVNDIQLERRLPRTVADNRTLGRQFRNGAKSLGLCDWNRVFGARKFDDVFHSSEKVQE